MKSYSFIDRRQGVSTYPLPSNNQNLYIAFLLPLKQASNAVWRNLNYLPTGSAKHLFVLLLIALFILLLPSISMAGMGGSGASNGVMAPVKEVVMEYADEAGFFVAIIGIVWGVVQSVINFNTKALMGAFGTLIVGVMGPSMVETMVTGLI